MRFSTFWFLDFQKLVFWLQERRMKPGETLPPRKPGNKPERRSRCVISKTYAKNAGADPEQTRSRNPSLFYSSPHSFVAGRGNVVCAFNPGWRTHGPRVL